MQSAFTHKLVPGFLACLLLNSIISNSHAQQLVEGTPISLPNQQLVIVGMEEKKLVVLKVFNSTDTTKEMMDFAQGDEIVELSGKPITNIDQFNRAYAAIPENSEVHMELKRDEKQFSIKFKKPSGKMVIPGSAMAPPRNWNSKNPDDVPARRDLSATEINVAIDKLLQNQADPAGPGMVIAVRFQGKTVYMKSAGLANLEQNVALTADSVLPIASLSKQFTGYTVALLVTRGKLDLDKTIDHWLPEIGLGNRITLRQLLGHSSGLKDYTGLMSLTGWQYGNEVDSQRILQLIAKQKELDFQPGSQHRYSNTNYALLPIIVERVSGKPFKEFVHEEVFEKLTMTSSTIPGSPRELIENRSSTYRSTGEAKYESDFGTHGAPGSGGIFSNVNDLLKWSHELIQPNRLDPDAVRLMTTVEKHDGDSVDRGMGNYGMGIGIETKNGQTCFSHSGSTPGSSSVLHVYPKSDLSIAIVSNYGEAKVYDMAESIASLLLPPFENQTSNQSTGRPAGSMFLTEDDFKGVGLDAGEAISNELLDSIAGRYLLADGRELLFEAKDGKLNLKLRADIAGVPLVHLGKGRFRFTQGRWEISFDLSTTPVQKLTLHLLEDSIRRSPPGDYVANRKSVETPGPEDLLQLTGTYFSDELNTAYEIVLVDNKLFLRHPQFGTVALQHYSDDTFGLPGRMISMIRFQREKSEPGSDVTGLVAEAYAWSATARFRKLKTDQ